MKRNFSFYDGLFFFFLLFKGRGWTFFDEQVTWFTVFLAYFVETLVVILSFVGRKFSVSNWIELQIWKSILWIRYNKEKRKAIEKARAEYLEAFEKAKTSNPGQFQDPQNLGE